ncbi:TetR/AcrR family transcriptional regulator [Sedimentisphaera salicampi]|uniref:TetR/AcrR family transcriptional regulator n=1 Tax=Sedimentisphaera salicampi TaxID=1941349 RepID=UPI000B9A606C|nr:CerR family C-terminal domain-containing protein [Sedimentisphaera salicampi]OXU14537.1 putative DNA-binding transcriptional regulator [Sedimentisphaera salicampi]
MPKTHKEVKDRLIEAGMEVFSEKGYRNATIAQICSQAEVNIASVNYYFGSKDRLYQEVWRRAFAIALEKYPLDGGLGEDVPPEDQLRAFIQAKVYQLLNPGKLGSAGKILSNELSQETEILKEIKHEVILPMAELLESIVRKILGSNAQERQVKLCAMSIINQCIVLGVMQAKGAFGPKNIFSGVIPDSKNRETGLEKIAEHIYQFSLAGIRKIAENCQEQKD